MLPFSKYIFKGLIFLKLFKKCNTWKKISYVLLHGHTEIKNIYNIREKKMH